MCVYEESKTEMFSPIMLATIYGDLLHYQIICNARIVNRLELRQNTIHCLPVRSHAKSSTSTSVAATFKPMQGDTSVMF